MEGSVSTLNGLQQVPAFRQRFGQCNAKGVCALTPTIQAITNSFAFFGKLIGALYAGPVIEKWGHQWCLLSIIFSSYIGGEPATPLLNLTARPADLDGSHD